MIQKNIPLQIVSSATSGPKASGVYILKLNGQVMKVGSAKIGMQKRMQQYYGLNEYCGLNQFITKSIRNNVTVTYQLCPTNACEELESKLFDKYGPVSNLPWAERRPNCKHDNYTLKI